MDDQTLLEDHRAIGQLLDHTPVTGWHRRITRLLGIGCLFNFFEVALGSLVVTLLPEAWADGSLEQATFIASAFVGEFLGAALLSPLADRLGRRTMFQVNLIAYAGLSILSAASPSFDLLVLTRILVGIGLGAELTLVDTYTTEMMPALSRGRMLARVYLLGFLGVPLAAALATLLPHRIGDVSSWRIMILASAAGACYVWIIRRRLPESPRWLASHERIEEARRIVVGAGLDVPSRPVPEPHPAWLVAEAHPVSDAESGRGDLPAGARVRGEARKRLALACLLQAVGPIAFYGFASLAPLVLVNRGYDVVDSLAFSALSVLGYPAGALVLVGISERFQRRNLVVVTSALVAGFGLVFGLATAPWLIVASGFATGLTNVVQATAARAYIAELFPTSIRARMVGRSYSLSRFVAGVLPFAALPLLDATNGAVLYAFSAVLSGGLAVTTRALGPRTNAVALDHV